MRRIVLLGLVAFLVLGLSSISYASIDNVYEASLIKIKGDVKVDTKGDGIWITPWEEMRLMEGALVKTAGGASAQIIFDAEGLNILNVKENSQITVKKSSVDLPGGTVLADFGNLASGSSFIVKTPTAACGIRGSVMLVGFVGGVTTAMAFQDTVYITPLDVAGNPTGTETTVDEGNKTEVAEGGAVETPTELTPEDTAVYEEWQDEVAGGGEQGETTDQEVKDAEQQMQGENDQLDVKDVDDAQDISQAD